MYPPANNSEQSGKSLSSPDWELEPADEAQTTDSIPPPPRKSAPAEAAANRSRPLPAAASRARVRRGTGRGLGKWLNGLLAIALPVLGLAWYQQDRLPPSRELLAELSQEPIQTAAAAEEAQPFRFSYRKREFEVKTLATYELWGVIVSHNDIHGLMDIYHDKNSLDTKDICVLWGDNATRDDYLKASFTSGAWTCNFSYPQGVVLDEKEIANNHLITDSDEIRGKIDGLRKGDQIHLRGRLVAYRDLKWTNFWRTSSLTRSDQGNGACEVVFVEDIEVLKPGNPAWRKAYRIAAWATAIVLGLKFLSLLAYLFKPADERLSGFWDKSKKR